MTRNIKAVVRYDGTGFSGWQVQPGRTTIQGVIEEALSRVSGAPVHIAGSGRTDAGVHALGQVFSCRIPKETNLDRIRRSLSKMLAPEIRIESVEYVDDAFHAQKSARAKRYDYALCLANDTDPFVARYSWRPRKPIDLGVIEDQAKRLVGSHDFAGFQGGKASVKTTVRTIHSISLLPGGVVHPEGSRELWRVSFEGDGFLYKMVRNITGTLVEIARGRLDPARINELLESPGPFKGFTAPAKGLFLIEVRY